MKRFTLPLLVLLALLLAPSLHGRTLAQDPDDETEIDISDPDDDGYDEEDQEKKNEGLAGRGKQAGEEDDAPPPPKLEGDLQARINEAIKKGVAWLEKAQLDDGSWGPVRANRRYDSDETGDWVRDPHGPTAFAIYTLAKCEVKRTDRTIKKGLAWLLERCEKTHDTTGQVGERDEASNDWISGPPSLTTYESAAIVLMIETLWTGSAKLTGRHSRRKICTDNPMSPPDRSPFDRSKEGKEMWRWMHDRILHLTVGRTVGGGGARGGGGSSSRIAGTQNQGGGWRYGQANGDQDLSATQFVLLGLRAASQAGYPMDRVSPDTWEWAAAFAKQCQNGDGSFSYRPGEPWTACMDACGLGILLICKEQIELTGKTAPSWIDDSIKRGFEHLDKVWDPRSNRSATGQGAHHYYHLYAVERVGDLTGRKVFNSMDWYLRGALFLLEQQAADGSWNDPGAFPPRDVLGTCYALLFLKRATPPVVTISEKGE